MLHNEEISAKLLSSVAWKVLFDDDDDFGLLENRNDTSTPISDNDSRFFLCSSPNDVRGFTESRAFAILVGITVLSVTSLNDARSVGDRDKTVKNEFKFDLDDGDNFMMHSSIYPSMF